MCVVSKEPSYNKYRISVNIIDRTYHLQLILPKLFLFRLVEERELADMVNKDVAEDGEAGIERRDFANVGPERCAESTEGCRGVEFGDFPFRLFAQELSF